MAKKSVVYKQRSSTAADAYIGQRIRARRMEMHMSQAELGDVLGVSFQQIQKYEKGVNRISATRLQQVADNLKTTSAHLMGDVGDGKMPPPSKMTTFLATLDGMKLMEAGMRLNHDHRRAVIDLARSLAKG